MRILTGCVFFAVLACAGALLSDLLRLQMMQGLLGSGGGIGGTSSSRSRASASASSGSTLANIYKLRNCMETPTNFKVPCQKSSQCLGGLLQCVQGMCCATSSGVLRLID